MKNVFNTGCVNVVFIRNSMKMTRLLWMLPRGEAHILVAVQMFSLAPCINSWMHVHAHAHIHTQVHTKCVCMIWILTHVAIVFQKLLPRNREKKFSFHVIAIFLIHHEQKMFIIILNNTQTFRMINGLLLLWSWPWSWCGWHVCVLLLGK
jgi:hypothetical protein